MDSEPVESMIVRYQQTRDPALREQIVLRTLYLARAAAIGYLSRHRYSGILDADDIHQAGRIALLKAIDGFDSTKGTKFSTYAPRRIFGGIVDSVRENDWVPRLERQRAKAGEVAPPAMMGSLFRKLGENRQGKESLVQETIAEPITSPRLDTRDLFDRVFSVLTPEEREIAERHFVQDYTLAEIGHELGLSESRVSQMMKTIKHHVRRRLVAMGVTY